VIVLRIPLGNIVATPRALQALARAGQSGRLLLARHASGDWGDVPPEDARLNDEAARTGERILSAYTLSDGTRLWIITEWDRSVTTLLLPDEY
jgi:hypothetical protein